MTFTEYLNADNEELPEISAFYLDYLSEFSSKDFPYEKQLQLKGVAGKFINSIDKFSYVTKDKKEKYFNDIDLLFKELRYYRKSKGRHFAFSLILPLSTSKNLIFRVQDKFQEIFTNSLELLNDANRSREFSTNNLNLNGFFKPENSNKDLIRKLILESIDLIKEDNSITEKTKKQLVEYLQKVLKRLEKDYTNWSVVFGNISEIIIVLGALGSFVAGFTPLMKAKEKLEETNGVIQKTSINVNYNTYNQTFNVQNIEQLEGIKPILLQQSNSSIETEEKKDE